MESTFLHDILPEDCLVNIEKLLSFGIGGFIVIVDLSFVDSCVLCSLSDFPAFLVICFVCIMAEVLFNGLDDGNPLFLQANYFSNVPISKNKTCFVDGTCVKPITNVVLAQQWKRCNVIVLSWIHSSLPPEMYLGQVYYGIAFVVWEELQETYDKMDGYVIFNHNQLIRRMQFLMGLNDVYQPIRSNILAKDSLPDVKDAFNVVSRDDSHRGLRIWDLLYVHKLITDSKLFVGFDEHKCYIRDLNMVKIVWTDNASGGLYLFDLERCGKSNDGLSNSVFVCHVSKQCKKQATISRSSTKAEYRCTTSTTCEIVLLINLLEDLNVDGVLPVPLYCDNTSAIQFVANLVFYEKPKHFEIDVHLVRKRLLLVLSALLGVETSPARVRIKPHILSSSSASENFHKLELVSGPPNLYRMIKAHPEMQTYIGLDFDPVAHEKAKAKIELIKTFNPDDSTSTLKTHTFLRNFKNIRSTLSEVDEQLLISGVDGILMDLGMSSMQVNNANRGFSVLCDGPLDMRMDPQFDI
uniref:MraW methylase family protein n=1 Tax=Tanacetum cinerariifolium TaxID=118510 RepID=A0A6L2MRZ2_TANCI|nr:MraW methylase family protein [Tanacetum cinerariifolium]